MKVLLIAAVLFASSTSFAISDEKLKALCLKTGIAKLQQVTQQNNCNADLSNVIASEVDNRWYNPTAYVWYSAQSDCNIDGVITRMVQYYDKKCY